MSKFRVMSFNINGVRARVHQLEAIEERYAPDVIGLQEVKVHSDMFPESEFDRLGWHVEHFGQKAHYGVALASKEVPVFVQKGFDTDEEEAQRRFIHCKYQTKLGLVDVMNGYFPQGESRDHPIKFPAKEKFYADLNRYIEKVQQDSEHLILMGDMNISPQDTDIGIGEPNMKRWLRTGKCSFLPEERQWYERLLGLGLQDTYRKFNPDSNNEFSWFDYRSRGFDDTPKRGLRIDHIVVDSPLIEKCVDAGISYDVRGMEKPSDHAPIWADFKLCD